jgi:transposase
MVQTRLSARPSHRSFTVSRCSVKCGVWRWASKLGKYWAIVRLGLMTPCSVGGWASLEWQTKPGLAKGATAYTQSHPSHYRACGRVRWCLQREPDGHKKPRLQVLHLLASGQAHSHQAVAHLLGLHRNTIGRWLAIYSAEGLDASLATCVSAGKPSSLTSAVLASLEQALHHPEGFALYVAPRQWVRQTHDVEIKYKTRYTIVWTRFRAKLKVPRPSHTKNPEAICAFQATCQEHPQHIIPPDNTRPIQVLARMKAASAY